MSATITSSIVSASSISTAPVFATSVAPIGSVIFAPPSSSTTTTTTQPPIAASTVFPPGERIFSTVVVTVPTIGVVNPSPTPSQSSNPAPNPDDPDSPDDPTPTPNEATSINNPAPSPVPNTPNQPTPTPSNAAIIITSGSRVITSISGSARPNTVSASTSATGDAARKRGKINRVMVLMVLVAGAVLAEIWVG